MAEALAAAFTDNLLTCSICLGEYEDPRVLSCYHTFCYGCICDHATRKITRDRTFPCPLCREDIPFPRDGLVKLKKDFRVHRTKELLSQRQQEEVSSPVRETDEHGVTQAIAHMAVSCERHLNNEIKYYCEDDDTVVCGDCILTEHSGHRISSVDKVAKSNRDKIKGALAKTEKTMNRFNEAVAMETANEGKDSYLYIRRVTIKTIRKQAQSMRKFIDQREQILISEVNSAYDNRKKQKEASKDVLELHHVSLRSACGFAQQLITNGTDYDIMIHAKALTDRLTEMEKTPVPTLDIPVQISYSPGTISNAGLEAMLGQVTVESQPSLAGQETNPRSTPHPPVFLEKADCVDSFSAKPKDDRAINILGIAIDEEQVFVVDSGNDRTKLFTHAGEFKSDIRLNRPFDVAVSQAGFMYITSQGDKRVKVYQSKGKHITTIGQGHLEKPRGITLNRQGHVMVCDGEKKSIFTFHAESGQLMNTIPLSMCTGPAYITVDSVNDNIVISDWGSNCVYVLSPAGDLLYQYGTQGSGDGELWSPNGVSTDSYGHIFIADRGNNRIVALSPQGQYIRYIATKDNGLNDPRGLAISPAGRLVVAVWGGKIKTFQYLQ